MNASSTAPTSKQPPRVCVFCGSRTGHDPVWSSLAEAAGAGIGQRGWDMVFGAGQIGLMGIVANAARDAGSRITGVIPSYLMTTEVVMRDLDELVEVETMIERKIEMSRRADAFLVLPGGVGTLEELFEVWTGAATYAHQKPMVIANTMGYFDGLLMYMEEVRDHGFLDDQHLNQPVVVRDLDAVFQALEAALSRVG